VKQFSKCLRMYDDPAETMSMEISKLRNDHTEFSDKSDASIKLLQNQELKTFLLKSNF
jgi:hypothetical protein